MFYLSPYTPFSRFIRLFAIYLDIENILSYLEELRSFKGSYSGNLFRCKVIVYLDDIDFVLSQGEFESSITYLSLVMLHVLFGTISLCGLVVSWFFLEVWR